MKTDCSVCGGPLGQDTMLVKLDPPMKDFEDNVIDMDMTLCTKCKATYGDFVRDLSR